MSALWRLPHGFCSVAAAPQAARRGAPPRGFYKLVSAPGLVSRGRSAILANAARRGKPQHRAAFSSLAEVGRPTTVKQDGGRPPSSPRGGRPTTVKQEGGAP